MMILRVRRGYTTNSSGGSEWVPPPDGGVKAPGENAAQPGALWQGAPSWAAGNKQVSIVATQPSGVAQPGAGATSSPAPGTASGRGAGNFGLLAALLAGICALFLLTGLLRRLVRRKKRTP